MNAVHEPVSLAAHEVLWQSGAAGLARPPVLAREGPIERPRAARAVEHELLDAGYLDAAGITASARVLLETLARPSVAIDVRREERTGSAPSRWRTRIAVGDTGGVVAVLGPDSFRTWEFPADELVDQTVELFPRLDPPPGFNGVCLPADLAQLPDKQQHLLGRPWLRRAHLHVITRLDRVVGGEQVSGPLVLNDTDDGRFLFFPDRWVVAPGSRQVFARKLKEMIES